MKKITFLIIFVLVALVANAQELITDGGFENTVTSLYTVSETGSIDVLKRVINIYDPGTNNCQATFPIATSTTVVAGQWVKKAAGDDGVKAIVQATGAHGGNNCLNLKIASGIATTGYTNWSNCVALQKVNSSLSNTNKYVVTFWAKLDGTASNNATSVTVILVDNTAKVVTNPLAATAVLTGGTTWTKYTVLLDIPKFITFNTVTIPNFSTAFLGFGIYTTYGTSPVTTNYSGVLIDDISLQQYSGTASTRYVKTNGNGDGTSWGAASNDIIAMLNDIPAGEVQVAAGTYTPAATIPIKDGINLTGAYAADGSGTRDLYANQTILDGNNVRRILQAPDFGAGFYNVTVVDGFVLQKGSSFYGSAAAITLGTVLQNCVIRNNNGTSYGAAVYLTKSTYTLTSNKDGVASGALINCVIHNNTSASQSAAVFCGDYAYFSMINCVIASNKCTTGVGGVYIGGNNSITYTQLQNNIFYNNSGSTYNNFATSVPATAMQIVLSNYFDDASIPVSGAYSLHANSTNNKTKTNYSTPNFANPTASLQGYDAGNSSNTTLINNSDWRLNSSSGLIGLGNSTQGIKFPYENMNANTSAGTARAFSNISSDIMGSTRVLNSTVEMGAYEYNPVAVTVSNPTPTYGAASGTVTVSKGTSVSVTATPNPGYIFVNWTNGATVSTLATYTFTPAANITLTANFVAGYNIAATSNNVVMGTVTGGTAYAANSTVTLTATASSGYHFVNWTEGGNSVSISATYTFSATTDRSLVANFALNDPLTITNFDAVNVNPSFWYGSSPQLCTISTIVDSDNNSNHIMQFTRTATSSVWHGPQWGNATTAPSSAPASGINVGTNASTQYHYLVARIKKSTTNPCQVSLQVQGQSNVSCSASNPVIANQWVTYVFDVSSFNNTYKMVYFMPENGGSASEAITYFDDIYFTNNPPVVATLDATITATSITATSASSGGNITADGGLSVTARGVCWSTSQNPTISDSKTADGTGTGSFTSSIIGLTPNTTYYVRSYATNSVGTGYGSQTSFSSQNSFTVSGTTSVSSYSTLNSSSTITVPNGATLTVNSNTNVSAITVETGGKLTVNNGITLAGAITLQSDATGTATLVDSNTSPTISATVQQYVEAGRNWYISSPISTANSSMLNRGDSVVQFNEVLKKWEKVTGSLTTGRGYIQTAVSAHGTTGTVDFNGLTSSGDITVSLTRTESGSSIGFNLVGNPYPSYLRWTKVATANSNVLPTAWFRTKKTTEAGGGYTFATVNVADTLNPIVVDNAANTTITKLIPPMQAYWVRLKASPAPTNFTVTNAMRNHADNSGNRFKAPKQNTQQMLRLQVSNGTSSDETVMYLNPNAANTYDEYDSPKMSNGNAAIPEIYTLADNEKLVINGLNSIPFDAEIPIGFTTGQSDTFSIKASQIQNFDSNTRIILKDKLLNTEQELTLDAPYSFTSNVTSSTNRFSLIFRTSAVSTDINAKKDNEQILVSKNANNQIVINIKGELTGENTASIYNAVGQKLVSISLSNSQTVINNQLSAGVYLVTVKSAGKTITGKIILN